VVILFQLYLLFPLLKAIVERIGTLAGVLFILAIHLAYAVYVPPYPYMDRVFVPYLLFFCAGMFWGRHYEQLQDWTKDHRGMVFGTYIAFTALYLNSRFAPESSMGQAPQLWQFFSLASVLLLMTVATSYAGKLSNPNQISRIVTLGAATFYVYLAHPLFIAAFYELFKNIGYQNFSVLMPICYGFTTILSFWGALQYLKFKSRKKENRAESNQE